jgi:hypothetical protein
MTTASEHPEELQIRFSVSAEFIVRTQTAELSWSVDNAEAVTIEPGIGAVGSAGKQTVRPNESVIYTLTATGPSGSKTATLSLNVFPTPLLERLHVPSPADIRLKALFAGVREHLPEQPKYTSTLKFAGNVPKLRPLNGKLIPPTATANDLSDALHLPKSELYASIGYSGKRVRTALFNRLERLFARNTKHSNVIKRLRRNYE